LLATHLLEDGYDIRTIQESLAAEQCAKTNEFKSKQLELVARILSVSVLMSLFGLILVLVSATVSH
jgi:site-specific recombinase XerC